MIRPSEAARLMEEGAQAAEDGSRWCANPYLQRENMPGVTGDSPQHWASKHDAWQRGFDAGGGGLASGKEALCADMLAEMVERRLRAMPRVQAELARGASLRVALPVPHARDERGRHWDLEGFECGRLGTDETLSEFRLAVDALRLAYDLA